MSRIFTILTAVVVNIAFKLGVMIAGWSKTGFEQLDPGVTFFLKVLDLSGDNPLENGKSIDEVRRASKKTAVFKISPPDIANICELSIPGPGGSIPMRIYNRGSNTPRPVMLYFHGGGWALGDLDSHDNICRNIARSNMILISIAYRRAPEHPYPAAIDDAYAALVWAHDNALSFNGNGQGIAVAGDSAGGNIAAALCLMARDRGNTSIQSQVLIYPVVDLSSMDTPSYGLFSRGYYLTKKSMELFRAMYIPESKRWADPYSSPLKAANLTNLPPAFILTAEFDILRDEAEAYASRLRNAGNNVRNKRYPGVIHGFVSLTRLTGKSDTAIHDIFLFLKDTHYITLPEEVYQQRT